MQEKKAKISKQLLRILGKSNAEYKFIQDGDRVAVGLSGGKDSLSLVHLLKHMQRHAPFSFEFEACTISYGMPDENYEQLSSHCQEYGIKHTVYETRIFEISQDTIREGSSFCSYYSRMRRGALGTFAEQGGFNKIALGHHLDDTVESFFMNMFYNGAMRAMAPIYKAERDYHVIRPLIEARERQLQSFAEENNFATIGDEACPGMIMKDVKMPYARAKTKEWLANMEQEQKNFFKMIKASFKHINDDTLLDSERWKRDDLD